MACTPMISKFLHVSPDPFGFLDDTIFQVGGITTYLGMTCPVMAPVVGRFFGKNGDKLEKNGPISVRHLCQVRATRSCTIYSS